MGRHDWYRRSTWTQQDQDEFYARWGRSRGPWNKAQYLYIQGACLGQAGLPVAGIELLDRVLVEFPEQMLLASARLAKANCLGALGQDGAAIDEYRAALQAERDFPNVQTTAWLEFGCFVVERQQTQWYDELERILSEFGERRDEGITFPAQEFQYYVIRAHLADAKGATVEASRFAKQALDEAAKTHSGLQYHATVGLVGTDRHKL